MDPSLFFSGTKNRTHDLALARQELTPLSYIPSQTQAFSQAQLLHGLTVTHVLQVLQQALQDLLQIANLGKEVLCRGAQRLCPQSASASCCQVFLLSAWVIVLGPAF